MTSFGGSRDAATSRQRVTTHHVKGGKTRVISIIDDEYLSKDTAKRESMALQDPTFEDVLQLAKQLTPGQKLRLIAAIAPDLEGVSLFRNDAESNKNQ